MPGKKFLLPRATCCDILHKSQAEGQGFEPCEAALETACSPRSIPLYAVHPATRVAGSPMNQGGAGGVEPLTSAFTEPRAIRYTTCRVDLTAGVK
jgi:hypothetical protein